MSTDFNTRYAEYRARREQALRDCRAALDAIPQGPQPACPELRRARQSLAAYEQSRAALGLPEEKGAAK